MGGKLLQRGPADGTAVDAYIGRLAVCSGMVALCAAPEVGTCVDAGDIFVRLCVCHMYVTVCWEGRMR